MLNRGGRGGKDNPWRPTDLIGAKLVGANLSGANLTRAILVRVDFTDANLHDAILRGAVLHLASLYGANLGRRRPDRRGPARCDLRRHHPVAGGVQATGVAARASPWAADHLIPGPPGKRTGRCPAGGVSPRVLRGDVGAENKSGGKLALCIIAIVALRILQYVPGVGTASPGGRTAGEAGLPCPPSFGG